VSDTPSSPLEKSLRRAGRGGITDTATPGADAVSFAGGQFIPVSLWEKEKGRANDALPGLLADFGAELDFLRAVQEQNAAIRRAQSPQLSVAGKPAAGLSETESLSSPLLMPTIPTSTVEARMKSAIRANYRRAFELGKRAAGNLLGITASDERVLETSRRDEYTFLRKFLSDIEARRGTMPYAERMNWYALAARELFWLGFVFADTKATRTITWHLGDTIHCADCARLAGSHDAESFARGVRETGMVPQSGALACRGFHCKCRLSD